MLFGLGAKPIVAIDIGSSVIKLVEAEKRRSGWVVRNFSSIVLPEDTIVDGEIVNHAALVEAVKNICGRFILNGVPTGVEVCLSMHHGGPFPATTDSRYTSVGADGIKRFARPIALQNWSNELLPEELKDENPLGIWRTVNNEVTKDPV